MSLPLPCTVAARRPLRLPLAAALGVALSLGVAGCTPANNVVTSAARVAFDDRATEEQVVDVKIKTGILDRLISIDKMLAVDLNVDVWKNRVMLTGTLSDANLRNLAVRAVQEDARITEFYNEVRIVTANEQAQRREWKEKAQAGAQKAAETIDDVWIETKIQAQLLGAEGINSVNYRWRSVLGTVYLLGEAQTARELNAVLTIIKNIRGVVALKTYVPVVG